MSKFKEKHGHCNLPSNHPGFGNWPHYQKSQLKLFKEGKKSKITKEKVDKLIEIGFFLGNDRTHGSDAEIGVLVSTPKVKNGFV